MRGKPVFMLTLTKRTKTVLEAAIALLCVLALCGFTPTANAATISGTLNLNNCAGGGVTVSANTIDWTLPVGGGDGCVQTGSGTNVTSNAGNLTAGDTSGIIQDLTMPTSFPVANFIVFTDVPGLHFDLAGLGPGSSNTTCSGLGIGGSCSVFAGSPFLLTRTGANTTTVTLTANGTAGDGTINLSNWIGSFTTQLNMTPDAIQTAIVTNGGSITSTYSGTFSVTTVPEADTSYLLFSGALLLGLGKLFGWYRKLGRA